METLKYVSNVEFLTSGGTLEQCFDDCVPVLHASCIVFYQHRQKAAQVGLELEVQSSCLQEACA